MKELLIINSPEESTNHTANILINELAKQGKTIAVAESFGGLTNSLTIKGATEVFRIGLVAYSLEAKLQLGVPRSVIDEFGEHSPEVSIAMNQAALRLRNDDLAISTIGKIDSNIKYKWAHILISDANGNHQGQYIHFEGKRGRPSIQSEVAELSLSNAYLFLRDKNVSFKNKLPAIISDQAQLLEIVTKNKAIQLFYLLKNAGLKIATIESCTGGAISQALNQIDGSSLIFESASIAYDEHSKQIFGVPLKSMIYGSVYSERVAVAMAKAIQRNQNLITIATTGTMETRDTRPYHTHTPPGKIYIAICWGNRVFTHELSLIPKFREKMKAEVVSFIFDQLILIFENKSSNEDASPIANQLFYNPHR